MKVSSETTIVDLPKDVLRYIFSFCDVDSNRQFFRVNKTFYTATQDKMFLLRLFCRVKDSDIFLCHVNFDLSVRNVEDVKNLIAVNVERRCKSILITKVEPKNVVIKAWKKSKSLKHHQSYYNVLYQNNFNDISFRPLSLRLVNVHVAWVEKETFGVMLDKETSSILKHLKKFFEKQLQKKFGKEFYNANWRVLEARSVKQYSSHELRQYVFPTRADVVLDCSNLTSYDKKLELQVKITQLKFHDLKLKEHEYVNPVAYNNLRVGSIMQLV